MLCPCNGTGLIGTRYCTREAGYTLRVHVEASMVHRSAMLQSATLHVSAGACINIDKFDDRNAN